ncbi:MAG TPA: tRNA 4-thiouridine(8) synthase ThiI [Patescibacteria group bacterium]|nr:tRNA 4-thiouridine(8) synthase ThiI [Patescibacteria group bacterium]
MKAFALLSGGLDSLLAAKLIKDQGVEVIALHFNTHFGCGTEAKDGNPRNRVRQAADALGIELKTIDIGEEFLQLLKNPDHGYGSHMNPCIDCKIMMLRKAAELLRQAEASFVITGEVLGQRPMSQHRQALAVIEKESGLEGLLLRPLSARLLPQTIAEKQGWVDRQKLLQFSGRTRKPQMALARHLAIKEYPNAAGGCLLTDPEFSRRLRDFMDFSALAVGDVRVLRVGRYFRVAQDARLFVGRNQKENQQLAELAQEGDSLFMPAENAAGPTALGKGRFNEPLIALCASIVARYCDDSRSGKAVQVRYRRLPQPQEQSAYALPLEEARLAGMRE